MADAKLAQNQTVIDAVLDTGGGELVLLLPLSMRGSVYAMERMAPGTRFLGVYLLDANRAEIACREMLSRGMAIKVDGSRIYNH
jgi:hypothetical protein